jgi:hypothetical protein
MPMSRAFRDMGASVIEDTAVISAAGLPAYFSHDLLTI